MIIATNRRTVAQPSAPFPIEEAPQLTDFSGAWVPLITTRKLSMWLIRVGVRFAVPVDVVPDPTTEPSGAGRYEVALLENGKPSLYLIRDSVALRDSHNGPLSWVCWGTSPLEIQPGQSIAIRFGGNAPAFPPIVTVPFTYLQ